MITQNIIDGETILTNDNGDTYRIGQRGRKPAWVKEHIEGDTTDSSGDQLDKVSKEPKEMTEPANNNVKKEKDNTMKAITETEAYKSFIESLDMTHFIHEGQVKEVSNLRDIMVKLGFTMTQNGIQPMIFNADFNSVQKASDGKVIMSAECVNRHAFDKNDLQDHFSAQGIIEQCSFLRGGIKTDANEKKNNCCLSKSLNTRAVATEYNVHENERLGFKADDDGENYLCEEQLYTDAVFAVDVNISINNFIRNITGMDFAQKNALKVIKATEEDTQEMLGACVPTKDGILDLDAIIALITEKFSNLKYFSHKGICAEFKVEKVKEVIDIL